MRAPVVLLVAALLAGGCAREKEASVAKAPQPEPTPEPAEQVVARPAPPSAPSVPQTSTEADHPTRPEPRARPRKTAGRPMDDEGAAPMRAGARRLEAYRPGVYNVAYTPDRGLKLEQVERARGGRRLAATVGPFAQRRVEQGNVADGGRAVAVALAGQLHAMGWLVELWADAAGDKAAPASPAAAALRFGFRGEVTFRVLRQDKGTCRGVLQGTVQVTDAAGESIYRARPRVSREVTREQEPRLTRRVARAESAVLRAFIGALLGDAKLGQALARRIRGG